MALLDRAVKAGASLVWNGVFGTKYWHGFRLYCCK